MDKTTLHLIITCISMLLASAIPSIILVYTNRKQKLIHSLATKLNTALHDLLFYKKLEEYCLEKLNDNIGKNTLRKMIRAKIGYKLSKNSE